MLASRICPRIKADGYPGEGIAPPLDVPEPPSCPGRKLRECRQKIGSAYATAAAKHQKALAKKAQMDALKTQAMFSILTLATSGALSVGKWADTIGGGQASDQHREGAQIRWG